MNDTCSICLSGMRRTKRTRVLGCGHYFHNTCLEKWEAKNDNRTTCPCCRYEYYKNRYSIKLVVEDKEDNTCSRVSMGYTRRLDDFLHTVSDRVENVEFLEIDVRSRSDLELLLGRLGADPDALVANTEGGADLAVVV